MIFSAFPSQVGDRSNYANAMNDSYMTVIDDLTLVWTSSSCLGDSKSIMAISNQCNSVSILIIDLLSKKKYTK